MNDDARFCCAPGQDKPLISHTDRIGGDPVEEGYYYTVVHIGTPPQRFSVILDTGSVITAVPCDGCANCGL